MCFRLLETLCHWLLRASWAGASVSFAFALTECRTLWWTHEFLSPRLSRKEGCRPADLTALDCSMKMDQCYPRAQSWLVSVALDCSMTSVSLALFPKKNRRTPASNRVLSSALRLQPPAVFFWERGVPQGSLFLALFLILRIMELISQIYNLSIWVTLEFAQTGLDLLNSVFLSHPSHVDCFSVPLTIPEICRIPFSYQTIRVCCEPVCQLFLCSQ